ncbi:hypothetical protein KAW65_00300 [candidate division WOR-3 bacterium]|nr:hypothetical protein [candidate division WOR-3 bacterium]
MSNNNGNGVTVKLREKAEKILLSKYERAVAKLKKEHRELTNELKKKLISEWGIDSLVKELVKLRERAKVLEDQIREKLGSHYGYNDWENWKCSDFHGDKLEKEVEARAKSKINLEQEEQRLKELKEDLLEELWLAGQPDEVKDVLSKMV